MPRYRVLALAVPLSVVLVVPASWAQDDPVAGQERSTPADSATSTNPEPTPADPANEPEEKRAEEQKKRPRLEIGQAIFDIGKIQKGGQAEVDFELVNRGDAVLRIRSARPSCGCTVTSYDESIDPGETGHVRAVLDTSTLEGPVSKAVTVVTNDPDSPRAVLTIRAEVLSYVRVSPSYARLLQVHSLEPATVTVHLWAEDGTALELGAIDTGADWITASARRAEPSEHRKGGADEQWRLEVSLAPEAPLGPLTNVLVVETNHPRQPRVEVPLSGFVRPLLSTVPPVADFGALGPRARNPGQFVLKLFNFGKLPIEVHSAETDLDFITVTVDPDEPGRRYRLRLALASDAPRGKFRGTLRVVTSSDVQPTVEVPVRGRVR
jgi:hypothetical protein